MLNHAADHILSMQQTLNFYEAILSHDHPAYIGILRLALISAKAGTDLGLVKLYIVTLTFLPLNIFTCQSEQTTLFPCYEPNCFALDAALFGMNVNVPHNGSREDHVRADGSRAPYNLFGIIVAGSFVVACTTWTIVWLIWRSSKRQYRKKRELARPAYSID